MQIAVTSQNQKTVTQHAGKCRKFWIYDVELGRIVGRHLVEVSIERSLHACGDSLPAPLAHINTLISAGMGSHLHQRLMQMGIKPVLTNETDPDKAVHAYLNNALMLAQNETHDPIHH